MYFLMLQDFANSFPTLTCDFVYFSTSVFSLVMFLYNEFSLSHLVCAVPCCACVIILNIMSLFSSCITLGTVSRIHFVL